MKGAICGPLCDVPVWASPKDEHMPVWQPPLEGNPEAIQHIALAGGSA